MGNKNISANEPKKENIFYNLLLNIILPAVILSKFSGTNYLGPVYGLIVALILPFGYGVYDIVINKKRNFISILGFVSILLTGIIGLLNFPPNYIAIKEAAIPFLIGLVLLISVFTPFKLLNKLVYNNEVLDINRIETIVNNNNKLQAINKVLRNSTIFLSLSFFISAILNFILAKILIQSNPGTTEFNQELGKMAMLSYPVIALPSIIILILIFWYLFTQLKKLTGLTTDELLAPKFRTEAK